MVELLFIRAHLLTALVLLLLAEDARETLVAAVRMRRGGANAWVAAVGHGGAVGSRRRRVADLVLSDFYVRASSWGRPPIWRVRSRESFCVSMRQYVRVSVGSARWRV